MIYHFGGFSLDLGKFELRQGDTLCPVEPQVFGLLAFLIEHRERLVSRDEIFEKLWDGRVVSDSALASRVKSARKALGDDGKAQRFIRTQHGQGLRFVADVRVEREEMRAIAADDAPANDKTNGGLPSGPVEPQSNPSIAVLPFRLLGEAGPYEMMATALPHELITELARLRWLFVTARGSSFRMRADEMDLREVGRLLNVRYCLSGIVEVIQRRLVVTTELTDTRGGGIIWAERYSGPIDDVHAVREDISSRLLTALEIHIPLHEATQARLQVSEDLDAWSAYHLGLQHIYRFNRSDNAMAAQLFRQATTRDPGFARAHAGLSFVHFQTAFLRQTNDLAGEIARARAFAERGLELDPLDPFVNFTMGRSFWLEGDLDTGRGWLERATALSPNYAQGIYARGWTETLAGDGMKGRADVDLAMRLSPLDPLHYAMLGTRALSHLAMGEHAQAAGWAERAARAPGAHVLIAMIAAAAHQLAGDESRAAAWADNVRSRNELLTQADFFRSFPMKPMAMRSRTAAALAGLGF
jgi:TolB-like protein